MTHFPAKKKKRGRIFRPRRPPKSVCVFVDPWETILGFSDLKPENYILVLIIKIEPARSAAVDCSATTSDVLLRLT